MKKTLIKNINTPTTTSAEDILLKAGSEDIFEKAHNVGDVHPNGKWVWVQLPNGKFDWRTMGGKIHKKTNGDNEGTNKQNITKREDKNKQVTTSAKNTSSPSNKISTLPKTLKTPIYWSVEYDGKTPAGESSSKSYKRIVQAKSEKEAERIYNKMYRSKGTYGTTLNTIRPADNIDNRKIFDKLGLDYDAIIKKYW